SSGRARSALPTSPPSTPAAASDASSTTRIAGSTRFSTLPLLTRSSPDARSHQPAHRAPARQPESRRSRLVRGHLLARHHRRQRCGDRRQARLLDPHRRFAAHGESEDVAQEYREEYRASHVGSAMSDHTALSVVLTLNDRPLSDVRSVLNSLDG